MDIGKLDKVVNFYTNTPFATSSGGAIDSYSLFCTTRGHLKKQSGSRGLSFGDIALESQYTLKVRYEALLATYLRVDNIVTIDTRSFKLSSIEQDEERKMWYRLSLNERSINTTFPMGIALNDIAPGLIDDLAISPTAGTDYAYDVILQAENITVLLVARESLIYTSTTGTPVGKQFRYVSSQGRLYFDPLMPFNSEMVYVLYKINA